jgi:hydrogenase maturation protease
MKTLIAGIGNVFFSDDGFGPAVVRLLDEQSLGGDARVRDFGIAGMHLALEMLEPYEVIILVDAIARQDPPGTVFVVEPDAQERPAVTPDAHAMDVRAVLALYTRLRRDMEPTHAPKILIVGCVPECTDEGMELSQAVRMALPRCAQLVRELALQHATTGAVQ